MGRYLGVDYGGRRTGLAISDTEGTVATPLGVIKEKEPGRVADEILRMCRERGVNTLVLGLPLNMDGSEGPAAQGVRRLAALLRERGGEGLGRIVLWDERLSTRQVESALRGRGRQLRERVDALAAQVILQSYLDARARGGGEIRE